MANLYPIREYKDNLFRAIFNEKKQLLALYNALNNSNYDDPEQLEIVTLENVFFLKMKNDVAFLINTNELYLVEHASTVCLNYPLRGLLYLSKEYEKILEERGEKLHKRSLIKIPTPRYVVFYNGREERPEREIFRLSDAFENKDVDACLEMTAEIININFGKNKELLNACKILGDYVTLVTKTREFTAQTGELADGIMRAIDYCIEHDCLKDFLVGARAEVESMLLAEGTVEEYMEDLEKEKDEKIQELDEIVQQLDEKLQEKEKENQRLRELLKAKGL
jgi:mRNA-degrading endonuclease HigB of HigAB toxin-antitoxin module